MPVNFSRVKRAMVCRTGYLGDTVAAIPAFRLIRQNLPNAELTLLGDSAGNGRFGVTDVVASLGVFDRIMTYRGKRGGWSVLEMFVRIWQARPDLIVLLPGPRESEKGVARKARFFRLCGVSDVRAIYHLEITESGQTKEPDRLISMLHLLGFEGTKPAYDLKAESAARTDVAGRLFRLGIDPARHRYLIFCGGGSTATQRWPLDRYALVLKKVSEQLDLPVVAVGTPSELSEYRTQIMPLFPDLKLFEGEMDSARLFEVMRGAKAYFGNNTGTMHAAAAVGCPVAAIISGRDRLGAWDPDADSRLVIRNRVECENCYLKVCSEKGHRCMLDIHSDIVGEQLLQFLNSLPRGQQAFSG